MVVAFEFLASILRTRKDQMNRKWIWVAVCAVSLISMAPAQQHSALSSSTSAAGGRFQIVSLEADEPTPNSGSVVYHEVFLLDTQTGKLWHYSPAVSHKTEDGKVFFFPEKLVEVKHEEEMYPSGEAPSTK
jgi:hypothetical protein